jgi:hypothetical protein
MEFGAFVAVLAVLFAALDQMRRQRAAGIRTNWAKTLLTGLGSVLITVAGLGAMLALMLSGHELPGLAAFVVIEAAGLTVLAIAVNRRWPAEPPTHSRDERP